MTTLRIGTRGSPLALWQARALRETVRAAGGPACEIVTIRTTGDRLATAALTEVGGKAVFVKEIEEALLEGRIDVAVHSAKDLPTQLPAGLGIVAVLPRADPRDAVVTPTRPDGWTVDAVRELLDRPDPGPRIGTGSVRRGAQLGRRYPDARFLPIRGNVGTRLGKLDSGAFDLLVLAAAGLERLGLAERIGARIPVDDCVPAPGQGIVAIETRLDDRVTTDLMAAITSPETAVWLQAERAVLTTLGGDCHVPIGAIARDDDDGDALRVTAIVAAADGTALLRRDRRGPRDQAAALGNQVAGDLLADGAAELIEAGRPPRRSDAPA